MRYILTGPYAGFKVELSHPNCLYIKNGYYQATSSTSTKIVSNKDILNNLHPEQEQGNIYETWPTNCYTGECSQYTQDLPGMINCINTNCIQSWNLWPNLVFRPTSISIYKNFGNDISGMIISSDSHSQSVTLDFSGWKFHTPSTGSLITFSDVSATIIHLDFSAISIRASEDTPTTLFTLSGNSTLTISGGNFSNNQSVNLIKYVNSSKTPQAVRVNDFTFRDNTNCQFANSSDPGLAKLSIVRSTITGNNYNTSIITGNYTNIHLEDASFITNTSLTGSGGVMDLSGLDTMIDCSGKVVFNGNAAGSLITFSDVSATIIHLDFSAISIRASEDTPTTLFTLSGNSTLTISGGNFSNNRSVNLIKYVNSSKTSQAVRVNDFTFHDNTNCQFANSSVPGLGSLSIVRSTIIDNSITQVGNTSIITGNYTNIHLEDTSFITNQNLKGDGGVMNLNGVGTTIDCSGKVVFNGNDASLGGAIYSNNNFTIQGGSPAEFRGNNAAGGEGGAIYTTNGVILDNSGIKFISNKASGSAAEIWGGAIFSNTDVSINFAEFSGNHSVRGGGAIYLGQQALNTNITNTTFIENSSNVCGGAIAIQTKSSVNINVTGSTFTGNKSSFRNGPLDHKGGDPGGGGIWYWNPGSVQTLTVRNTALKNPVSFIKNQADTPGTGGAIKSGANLELSGYFKFESNRAATGGALFADNDVSLTGIAYDFSNNSATADIPSGSSWHFDNGGGAIYALRSVFITIETQATFTSNLVQKDVSPAVGSFGGAIYASAGSIYLDGSFNFKGNQSERGGALTCPGNVRLLNGSFVFKDNSSATTYGGAIQCLQTVDISAESVEFMRNISKDEGGAIYGRFVTIKTSGPVDFKYNKSTAGGGAIYSANTISIKGSGPYTFLSNESLKSYGGALSASGGITFDLQGNNSLIFKDNSCVGGVRGFPYAVAGGGAIYSSYGTIDFTNVKNPVQFKGNRVSQPGELGKLGYHIIGYKIRWPESSSGITISDPSCRPNQMSMWAWSAPDDGVACPSDAPATYKCVNAQCVETPGGLSKKICEQLCV